MEEYRDAESESPTPYVSRQYDGFFVPIEPKLAFVKAINKIDSKEREKLAATPLPRDQQWRFHQNKASIEMLRVFDSFVASVTPFMNSLQA